MKIGDYEVPATVVPEMNDKINNLKEQASLYNLSFSEYILFLLYDEGVLTYSRD